MRDRQEGGACGVDAQRPWSEADPMKAVCFEERQLERVPTSFRPDGDEHAPIAIARGVSQRSADRRGATWIGDETDASTEQSVQVILHEDPELPMDRNRRQPRVACLLEPF